MMQVCYSLNCSLDIEERREQKKQKIEMGLARCSQSNSQQACDTTWKKRKTLKGRERKGISREVQQAEWLKREGEGECGK